jgi:ArsR family transcriptional regulator, arsenate/arsenite/antimonite-responsive transcriptional repressor
MREFVDVARALSDPGRVRILLALRGRELCVCQIVELLGLAGSTVSKHMAVLRQARLVELRKDGHWAYYRRAGRETTPSARTALRWLDRSLSGERLAGDDARRLHRILRTPVEELCRSVPAARTSRRRAARRIP